MATGSQLMTTYYAKRIMGDNAAADASDALLQTGEHINVDTWILHRENRTNLYGIKYKYDNTETSNVNNGHDKIELYGGYQISNVNMPTAWVQLDTGDIHTIGSFNGDHLSLIGTGNTVLGYDENNTSPYIELKNSDNTKNIRISLTTTSNKNGITINQQDDIQSFLSVHGYLWLYSPDVDMTDANNGVSSGSIIEQIQAIDSNGYDFGLVQFNAASSGAISNLVCARNIVDSTNKYIGIYSVLNKDGTGNIYLRNNAVTNQDAITCAFDSNENIITLKNKVYFNGNTYYIDGGNYNGNSATATKWAAAQKVYVTLGTASTTTTIQGGSTSAETIGVDGTLGVGNGGTGKASWTKGGILYASATNTLAQIADGSADKVLRATASATYSWLSYTSSSTASTLVYRDASKNFSAGTITATLSGNASTATKLSTTGGAAKFWRGDNAWSDTISGGTLKITANSNTVTIGSQNGSWCHFTNSANISFYFNHQVHAVDGFVVYNTNTKLTNNSLAFASGGGWSMSDTTWIRTVGSKSVYMNAGTFRCDGTIQAGSSGNYTWSNGGVLTTSRLIATSATDAAGNAANTVALVVGGYQTGAHIEMDNNEIIAKSNGTTKVSLWFNDSAEVTADGKVKNAVWNDYAEYRQADTIAPGYCVATQEDGIMHITNSRMCPGARIVSDTFGHAIGMSDTAKTPIAVAGRVLVYPYQDKNNYHIGDCVCATYDGKVDIMTREEIKEYPDRIVGIVDEIPNYNVWEQSYTFYKTGELIKSKIKVKGRIWVYVK